MPVPLQVCWSVGRGAANRIAIAGAARPTLPSSGIESPFGTAACNATEMSPHTCYLLLESHASHPSLRISVTRNMKQGVR